jgi:hypothetical protein
VIENCPIATMTARGTVDAATAAREVRAARQHLADPG